MKLPRILILNLKRYQKASQVQSGLQYKKNEVPIEAQVELDLQGIYHPIRMSKLTYRGRHSPIRRRRLQVLPPQHREPQGQRGERPLQLLLQDRQDVVVLQRPQDPTRLQRHHLQGRQVQRERLLPHLLERVLIL